jgi:LuxR family maltose regulon positive regulatory protein
VFERRPALAFGAALVHALNGRADAAEHMADAVERATFDEPPGNGAASLESMQAMLAAILVRNGAEAALASAAVAAAAEGPRSPWWTLALEVLADAHLMCGNADAAAAALDNAIAAAPTGGSYGFYGHALRASVAVARGEWHQAERYEALVRVARLGAGMGASAIVVHGVAARIALHHGDVAHGREALVQAQLLRPLASRALPAVAVHGLIEVARAYLAIADPAGAGRALAEAEAILRHRPGLGVYGEQLAALRQRTHASAATLVGPSTLTPAELRLLPLLSTHLMFQDIADRLGVSRHTVKTQVVSIYGKLGASSRGEAIERAIEVGLLEPFPGLRLVDHRRPD